MKERPLAARLGDWLSQHREEMTEFVSELVRLETPSPDTAAQQPLFQMLSSAFGQLGMEVSIRAGETSGGVLQATSSQEGARYQMLLGHCDTVWPWGTLREMPLKREGNRLSGPGIFDMKSGLAHMVFALRALKELGVRLPVPVRVLINSDEEVGSHDSRETIRKAARNALRVFVLEPSAGEEGKLKTARKGIAQFEVRIRGKASHAGLAPEEGVSAILELSYLIQELWSWNDPKEGISVNVGVVKGGMRPNVVAPEAMAGVDVRVVSRKQLEQIREAVYSLQPSLKGAGLEIENWHSLYPLERTPLHRPLWERARRAASELGFELGEALVGGGSDGNLTSQYAPTLDGLGAVGGGAHARHEFILLDQMLLRTALLGLLLASKPPSNRPEV